MKLSVVTTLYRSSPSIDEFYSRSINAAEAITDDIELVFVNDGSPDNSIELAIALHQTDSRVVVIDLARNFGHHKAMMTGLAHATGELIFLIDSDAQAIGSYPCGTTSSAPDYIVVSIPDGYPVRPVIPFFSVIDTIALRPRVKVPYGGT